MCKKLLTGVLALFLTVRRTALVMGLLALTACSTGPKWVRELPPQELLADCPTVVEELATNGGLARTILAYRRSLSTCNTDKASLREWAGQ